MKNILVSSDYFLEKYTKNNLLNQTTDEVFIVEGYMDVISLNKSGIKIDRKILAEIAYDNPEAFKTIVKKAQSALN